MVPSEPGVYLIIQPAFKLDVMKVGRSKNLQRRVKQQFACMDTVKYHVTTTEEDSKILEAKLKEEFKRNFGDPIQGNEYFQGDRNKMKEIFDQVINDSGSPDLNVPRFTIDKAPKCIFCDRKQWYICGCCHDYRLYVEGRERLYKAMIHNEIVKSSDEGRELILKMKSSFNNLEFKPIRRKKIWNSPWPDDNSPKTFAELYLKIRESYCEYTYGNRRSPMMFTKMDEDVMNALEKHLRDIEANAPDNVVYRKKIKTPPKQPTQYSPSKVVYYGLNYEEAKQDNMFSRYLKWKGSGRLENGELFNYREVWLDPDDVPTKTREKILESGFALFEGEEALDACFKAFQSQYKVRDATAAPKVEQKPLPDKAGDGDELTLEEEKELEEMYPPIYDLYKLGAFKKYTEMLVDSALEKAKKYVRAKKNNKDAEKPTQEELRLLEENDYSVWIKKVEKYV